MENNAIPWAMGVVVQDIPEAGLHLEIEAPEEVRTALARLVNVSDIKQVVAAFDLTRRGAGVHVAGQVKAQLRQTCVVSLELMDAQVDETVDLLFMPGKAVNEVDLAEVDEELPEPLLDGKIDVAAITTEFLLLGIDPYPRKPGVEFSAQKADDNGVHPFAALETLKRRQNEGQS